MSFGLWRCNVDAWLHWCNVQTMWASDGGCRTGLRVADVQAYMELAGVPADERNALYALLHECEHEALEVYAQLREADEQERERKRQLRK